MTKQLTDAEIIKLSLKLLSPEDRQEIQQDATALVLSVHEWNYRRERGFRPMFGEAMSYELLYKLGRFINEEYPIEDEPR